MTFGTLSKDTIKKIPDFSILQNSEQYGKYSSQEELTNSIQNDKKQDLADYGLYNPSANKDKNGEHQTVKFIKEYNNSTIYVVEVVPNKSKTLTIKTMWKKQIGLNHSNNALLHTSKTKTNIRNSTFINNSITQNNKSVKNTRTKS